MTDPRWSRPADKLEVEHRRRALQAEARRVLDTPAIGMVTTHRIAGGAAHYRLLGTRPSQLLIHYVGYTDEQGTKHVASEQWQHRYGYATWVPRDNWYAVRFNRHAPTYAKRADQAKHERERVWRMVCSCGITRHSTTRELAELEFVAHTSNMAP